MLVNVNIQNEEKIWKSSKILKNISFTERYLG